MFRLSCVSGILSLALFISTSVLAAPEDQSHARGLGVLACPVEEKGVYRSACFEAGPEGVSGPVSLYAQPDTASPVAGTIFSPSVVWGYENMARYRGAADGAPSLKMVDIGYEQEGVVVYEENEGWFRTSAGWFRGADVAVGKGTVYLKWADILEGQISEPGEHGPWRAEFFPIADQVLYDAPDGKPGEHVWESGVEEDAPDIFVMETKGPWIKVLVDRARTSCGNGEEPKGPVGWIRMTDPEGYPLVHWNTGGC